MFTIEELIKIYGCPQKRAELWQPYLDAAMMKYDINTVPRVAAFLAQIGHESGRLLYVRELWNPAQVPAQGRYEGRADLGNTIKGDGFKYRGRGLIQITGRANYKKCSDSLGVDFISHPELLELPKNASLSAALYWSNHHCNQLADSGNFREITHVINGGFNGWDDRLALFETAKNILQEKS